LCHSVKHEKEWSALAFELSAMSCFQTKQAPIISRISGREKDKMRGLYLKTALKTARVFLIASIETSRWVTRRTRSLAKA
jgi:hypothetical protein